ncbi:DUF3560 domain-containing protein [Acidovorax sp. LjRoot129]|uniref:DUF3560 domain-containing protein n=1 Tax=Acidovorax sp. LjRoot129 TaxID=3342260 RepID=UPI003ED0827A
MRNSESRTTEILQTRRDVYGDRAERRRDGLAAKAAALEGQGQQLLDSARSRASNIPFGQPILVGHHSEGRDRRYREKIHNDIGRGIDLLDQAKEARSQVQAVGIGISSDDPDALVKLRDQLLHARKSQDLMTAANKQIRKHKGNTDAAIAALVEAGMTEINAREALKPDFMGRVGFPSYALSNNNANMRRIELRIKEIERNLQAQDVERKLASGVTYREDVALNRVMLHFGHKPDQATREVLKRNGFRWAPSNEAWQRQLNNAGRWGAKSVIEALGLDNKAEA